MTLRLTAAFFGNPRRAAEGWRSRPYGIDLDCLTIGQVLFFRNLPGLAVRSGLHTGEIESKRDEICGIAMHTVTRDGAMAEPSETLVSKIKG